MKKMLQSTVENAEAKFVFPKEYKIGGKTGTAQVAVQGKYDASKTIASFIGFAPVDDPQFIALVVVKEPKSSQWGSETAAPVFFDIAKDLFVYYNIVPKE
jgi:cell division protein FtsI/penicillin-binding protein 2